MKKPTPAEWIPVSDIMPDKFQDIVFLEPFTESISGRVHLGYHDGNNWLSGDLEDLIKSPVTHWIPIASSAAVID